MIERSWDVDRINSIANDPDVFPWISGDLIDHIDVSKVISDELNVALMGDHGGFVFVYVGAGVFDAHSIVLREGRGPWAMEAAKESLDWIFDFGASEVLMRVPVGNIAVRALVKRLGAKLLRRDEKGWWKNGREIPADIYSVKSQDWKKCH